MTNLEIGFVGTGAMLVLLILRVPIGATLGIVAVGGIWVIRGPRAALGSLGTLPYEFCASWTLSAVPMFLLLGAVAYHMGLTKGLYEAARAWMGRLPGGLAIASNWACTLFGAASGSSVATTAAMGKLAIPEMLRLGYHPALATGAVAAAGTIDALIPPSIAFVIYGWYAEAPIDKLLIAGILPGLLTAFAYMFFIMLICRLNPALAPTVHLRYSLREKVGLLKDVWPLPLLILGVVGALWSGAATSTEAAAFGAAMALVIALIRRSITREALRSSFGETAKNMSALFFVVVGAVLFTRFLAVSGLPAFIATQLTALGSKFLIILFMLVIYLILGMLLDPIGVMLITLPVLVPVCRQNGIDLIWIGVLVVKLVEVGMLTPPVGFHCFVLKAVVGDKVPLPMIFRGACWFIAADAVVLTLLIAFPQISLYLPGMMK
ncbi:MAG: putative rane protein (TrapT family, dctM subunit transport precursor) [Deltaproteobacteria bacterium]|jgi:tripartite ATP-independent transporter DctM subunit|nr:putative rane protein (TrapT family, dctM subunit transport precursor) [Deltaproteobacteria bacterium]